MVDVAGVRSIGSPGGGWDMRSQQPFEDPKRRLDQIDAAPPRARRLGPGPAPTATGGFVLRQDVQERLAALTPTGRPGRPRCSSGASARSAAASSSPGWSTGCGRARRAAGPRSTRRRPVDPADTRPQGPPPLLPPPPRRQLSPATRAAGGGDARSAAGRRRRATRPVDRPRPATPAVPSAGRVEGAGLGQGHHAPAQPGTGHAGAEDAGPGPEVGHQVVDLRGRWPRSRRPGWRGSRPCGPGGRQVAGGQGRRRRRRPGRTPRTTWRARRRSSGSRRPTRSSGPARPSGPTTAAAASHSATRGRRPTCAGRGGCPESTTVNSAPAGTGTWRVAPVAKSIRRACPARPPAHTSGSMSPTGTPMRCSAAWHSRATDQRVALDPEGVGQRHRQGRARRQARAPGHGRGDVDGARRSAGGPATTTAAHQAGPGRLQRRPRRRRRGPAARTGRLAGVGVGGDRRSGRRPAGVNVTVHARPMAMGRASPWL